MSSDNCEPKKNLAISNGFVHLPSDSNCCLVLFNHTFFLTSQTQHLSWGRIEPIQPKGRGEGWRNSRVSKAIEEERKQKSKEKFPAHFTHIWNKKQSHLINKFVLVEVEVEWREDGNFRRWSLTEIFLAEILLPDSVRMMYYLHNCPLLALALLPWT